MATATKKARRPDTTTILPLEEYDRLIVSFSGGKDSLALALHLIELGVPREKIELWHQSIDGAPGAPLASFMDWPITESYCRAVAEALGVTIRFQWKSGGFEGELLRENALTRPAAFETDAGTVNLEQGRGKEATRLQFPQQSGDLSVRWCSAYLKIDVARRAITNDPRLKAGKFLFLTGERREESPGRALYAECERHTTTTENRRVDHWRAVIDWTEADVWAIISRWYVKPHPAYYLGWSRTSCMTCIFGDRNQWASARALAPERFERIAALEERFGKTIKQGESIREQADRGASFLPDDPSLAALALGATYTENVIDKNWTLPRGAYKNGGGPI